MPLADTFAALGHPVRFAIVERLLRDGELAAGDLVAEGAMSAPAMSHHFKVLREAGLTRTRAEGTHRFVALRRAEVDLRFPGLLGAVLSAAEAEAALTAVPS